MDATLLVTQHSQGMTDELYRNLRELRQHIAAIEASPSRLTRANQHIVGSTCIDFGRNCKSYSLDHHYGFALSEQPLFSKQQHVE